MYAKILVPLDGSPLAEQAALHAAELSRFCGSQLTLVSVCADKAGMQRQVEYLEGLRHRLEFHRLAVRGAVRVGEPAPEIVAAALEEDSDLIVICSHGRTGLARTVFGSVAETVVRAAHCPVTVVKANGPQPLGNVEAVPA
ncbi:MAG: universal stress protein [Vulcanimicrobiota bacterium]